MCVLGVTGHSKCFKHESFIWNYIGKNIICTLRQYTYMFVIDILRGSQYVNDRHVYILMGGENLFAYTIVQVQLKYSPFRTHHIYSVNAASFCFNPFNLFHFLTFIFFFLLIYSFLFICLFIYLHVFIYLLFWGGEGGGAEW